MRLIADCIILQKSCKNSYYFSDIFCNPQWKKEGEEEQIEHFEFFWSVKELSKSN